jgi:hypothetical protein
MQKDVEEQKDLGAEIEQYAHISREMAIQKAELEQQTKLLEDQKKIEQIKLEKIQEKQRMFNEKKIHIRSKEQYETSFQESKNQETQLRGLIDNLVEEYPHLAEQLSRLKERLNPV